MTTDIETEKVSRKKPKTRLDEIMEEWNDLETDAGVEAYLPKERFAGPVSPMTIERARRTRQIDQAHTDDQATKAAVEMLARLLLRAESGQDGRGVLVTGPSGGGKSHIIDRFRRLKRFRPFETETGEGTVRPLVYLEAPAPCTMKFLGMTIYETITGHSLPSRLNGPEIWSRVKAQMKAHRMTILVIDEFHNVLSNTDQKDRSPVAKSLKSIMKRDDWNVYLVIGGMPETNRFKKTFPEIERRVESLEIGAVASSPDGYAEIAKHMKNLASELGFGNSSELWSGKTPHRMHVASGGYLGIASCLAKMAAELAVDFGEPEITVDLLADAYDQIHDMPASKNPFHAKNFEQIKSPDMTRQNAGKTRVKGTGEKA